MKYIEQIIQPGEKLLYSTTLHWIVYLPAVITAAAAVVLFVLGAGSAEAFVWNLAAFAVLVFAVISGIGAWVRRWTTEIDVTDRRIVYKRGLVRRRTVEMNMDKVESVDVDQSIAGRILDYGDIIVRGTGVGIEPLHKIDAPLQFRNHVTAR